MYLHEQPSDAQIALAASLRATGKSWEAIGEAVNRSGETVRHWPERYPARWNQCYRMIEKQIAADAANEARATLRLMLRGKNGKTRLGAASQLLKYRDRDLVLESKEAAAEGESRAEQLLREYRSMSDEELNDQCAAFARERNEIWVSDGEGI
jgi:hypothetical protein